MVFGIDRHEHVSRAARLRGVLAIGLVICASCSGPKQPATPSATATNAPHAQAAAPTTSGPVNVLFVLADTFRADRVLMQRDGLPLMPNIAKLAGESWYYRNCHCQAAWTKPSIATLFTSLYPDVHRVLFGIERDLGTAKEPQSDVLPASFETMAEYLKSHGYATAGVQSNTHVTEYFGFNQGFDSYIVKRHPEFHGNDITNAAIEELDKLKPPFFLYAHYMDAHGPYDLA